MPREFTKHDYYILRNYVKKPTDGTTYSYETFRKVFSGDRNNELIKSAIDFYFTTLIPELQTKLNKYVIKLATKKQR